MAHDVFLSYSSQDKPIADAVCAALESKKIRCWIAPRDVLAGVPYGEALAEALHGSRLLVLVLSARANESRHIMREVESAVDKGIPIVPFRIENIQPSKSLDYFLKAIHWLDAMTPPLESHLDKLSETVRSLLARQAGTAEGTSSGVQSPGLTVPPPAPAPAWKRWRLPAFVGVALLALGAIVIIPRLPYLSPGSEEKKPDPPVAPVTTGPRALDISFQVKLLRPDGKGEDLVLLGDLGEPNLLILQDDRFEVQASFNESLHPYVLAINPDGSVQLLVPDSKESGPMDKLRAPLQGSNFYTLDDAGVQGVVLAIAEKPLPEFDQWRPELDQKAWQKLKLGLPWKWDGQSVVPMTGKRVGVAEYGPTPLAAVCRQLQSHPAVLAVHAAAFYVQPKTPSSEGAKKP